MNHFQHRRCTWVRSRAAAVLACAVLLAGCTFPAGARVSEESRESSRLPDALGRTSSAPIPTHAPSPAYKPASVDGPAENVPLPVMPEEAKVQSKEGLEAFTRYWYELANYSYETGDTESVRAVTLPTSGIGNFFNIISTGYTEDDWVGRAHITVRSLESEYVLTVNSRYQIVADIFQDPVDCYEPDGSFTTVHPKINPGRQLLEFAYTPDGWCLENIVTLRGN